MAVRDVQSPACQLVASIPKRPSTQFTTPKSRLKIWPKMRVTATMDVTFGRSTPMRNRVRRRVTVVRTWARMSASTSCGTEHISIRRNVFLTAFQK